MNREWSELNKAMQIQIKKKETYAAGISVLLDLRNKIMDTVFSFRRELTREDFNAIPFINAEGYHNKTISYSLWHVFRIEDIVAHSLIMEDEQILFRNDYQKRIGAPIITTGNELIKQQIANFSSQLNLEELYSYISDVKQSTDEIIHKLTFIDLKNKIPDSRKEYLKSLHVVSENESAIWLIDYWCNKDIRGLIQMPFSRHWIMHIEACQRIRQKIAPQSFL